jgi:hypothetical protein
MSARLACTNEKRFHWPPRLCCRSQLCFCMLPLTHVFCLILLGWTDLPRPPLRDGIGNSLCLCAGCHLPISRSSKQICCRFATTGFSVKTRLLCPCCTRYHMRCFTVGVPFKTRLTRAGGLTIPPGMHKWPHFICEACTVRSLLARELSWSAPDTAVLMLERMRILDMFT